MRAKVLSPFLLFILHVFVFSQTALGEGVRLQADGPELVLSLDNGRILRGDTLVGIRFVLTGPDGAIQVRIDGVEEDKAATGGPLLLYSLSVHSPEGEEKGSFCSSDPQGRRVGFAMPDGSGGFSFTCTSGAEGKCVRMGYRPWDTREGLPLKELHRACVHMLRADYGGDDRPTTRNGTSVDIFDRFGIQRSEKADGMEFEAAWGPNGALCVAHPRIAQNVTLGDIAARYPRLTDQLGPRNCSLEMMGAEPQALLFNHSYP
ncbi:ADYC domain-containing protein [Microvirga calopogonii]|uniref:ADYC domain-containing protein n=1 Tax=Microvirga calopogonii TaxID=2078013 RepID=UPI000E0CC531|nr:ADYC domain-containing protein [Microvirga calopogonii]